MKIKKLFKRPERTDTVKPVQSVARRFAGQPPAAPVSAPALPAEQLPAQAPPQPSVAEVPAGVKVKSFCPGCGAQLFGGTVCPVCGERTRG